MRIPACVQSLILSKASLLGGSNIPTTPQIVKPLSIRPKASALRNSSRYWPLLTSLTARRRHRNGRALRSSMTERYWLRRSGVISTTVPSRSFACVHLSSSKLGAPFTRSLSTFVFLSRHKILILFRFLSKSRVAYRSHCSCHICLLLSSITLSTSSSLVPSFSARVRSAPSVGSPMIEKPSDFFINWASLHPNETAMTSDIAPVE
mmetsp:Transcript_19411/g.28699  ORF Transcript_19411/g.28699 Transcript_19411/m.28699 type:complete len:206 (+) Transcript_19411:339-956(+)